MGTVAILEMLFWTAGKISLHALRGPKATLGHSWDDVVQAAWSLRFGVCLAALWAPAERGWRMLGFRV